MTCNNIDSAIWAISVQHAMPCTRLERVPKFEASTQKTSGACIVTGCTKSTPIAALMRESDLLPLADQAEIATARQYQRALRRRQDTPTAQAARRLEEITRRGDSGRRTRPQAHRPGKKSSWRDTAEDIARRAGIDNALVEPTTLGPPPWI